MNREREEDAAVEIVTRFLNLMENRELDAASRLLAADVEIVFPGNRRFDDLGALVESASGRYRKVKKTIDLVDVMSSGDIENVVYVIGRLSGINATGDAFEDVRFIDRLVVREGLITDHRVWNDLAESGVVAGRGAHVESSS